MKIPLSWVREFVDVPEIEAEKICDAMTMSGSKVEAFEKTSDGDIVIDFEITSNRKDCNSVLGMAREFAATFKTKLKENKFEFLDKNYLANSAIELKRLRSKIFIKKEEKMSLSIENEKICSRFFGVIVRNFKNGQSPDWLKAKLIKVGIRPRNLSVDISNLVMIEIGQPLHAYDMDKISGNLKIRLSRNGEIIKTLDGNLRELPQGVILICDKDSICGIAGIMGGFNSAVTDDSSNVLFESAIFDANYIRTASKLLKLRTSASSLFEKQNPDPDLPKAAVFRICELIEEIGCGKLQNCSLIETFDKTFSEIMPVKIPFEIEKINSFLGIELTGIEIKEILSRLDFKINDNIIHVPSFRSDVENIYDICEEVARLFGYDKIIPKKGLISADLIGKFDEQKFEDKITNILLSNGCYEIITSPFLSSANSKVLKNKEKILKILENCAPIEIKNPFGEETRYMRTTLLFDMLKIISKNISHGNSWLKFYEISNRYFINPISKLPSEKKTLTIGIANPQVDYKEIKGIIDSIIQISFINNFEFKDVDSDFFISNRSSEITALNKENIEESIGIIGAVNPKICNQFSIPNDVYIAELDFEKLFKYSKKMPKYFAISKFPIITRDISMIVDNAIRISKIQNVLRQAQIHNKVIESFDLFDIYRGDQIKKGSKSVSYSIKLRGQDSNLNEIQIEEILNELKNELNLKLSAVFR